MRATLTWTPGGTGDPVTQTVYVSPQELAGVRSVLRLDAASLRKAIVRLKTPLPGGRVTRCPYTLAHIQAITTESQS